MENLSKLSISGLRNSAADILCRKSGKQSANGNELHVSVIDIDNDAAAEAVIPMHQSIQQIFTKSFFRLIGFFDPIQSLEHSIRPVAEGQVRIGIVQLFEDRTAELLGVLKGQIYVISENGHLRGVLALVRKQQRQVGILIVINK